jgi:hypothetical protein
MNAEVEYIFQMLELFSAESLFLQRCREGRKQLQGSHIGHRRRVSSLHALLLLRS